MNKFLAVVAVIVVIELIACTVLLNNLKKNIVALDESTTELCLQVQEMEQMLQTLRPNIVMEELDCAE